MSFSSRTRRGSRAPNAVLSREQVLAILELAELGLTVEAIRAALGLTCSRETIRKVVIGASYRDERVDSP